MNRPAFDLLLYFSDLRILTAVLIGTLGMTFLLNASPRSWPYVRWLAGSTLVFGLTQLIFRTAELRGWVPRDNAGPIGAAVGLAAWAAVMAGLHAFFAPDGGRPLRRFVVLVLGASVAVALLHLLTAGWTFAGPLTVAVIFAFTSGWMLWQWQRDRWRGQLLLAAAFMIHPLFLGMAIAEGLSLQEFRQLTPLPVTVAYVVVLTLILQRDGQRLALELRERERAEAQLRKLAGSLEDIVQGRTRQLEEVVAGLRSFAGMVSHDLRGPLGNVANLADLARRAQRDGDQAKADRYLGMIRDEALRATDMVSDLLTLARVDHGLAEREQVDMRALIADCVRTLALQYPQAPSVVQVGDMPRLSADPGLLRHAVLNLLGNALKFGRDHADLRVVVEAQQEGDDWRFSVSDNGDGFDPARAGELFKPFARLDAGRVTGTGLGLTVVRRVIERHGGRVGALSRPGQGATFWWTLPAVAGAAA